MSEAAERGAVTGSVNEVAQDRIRAAVAELLAAIGENPAADRLAQTPTRVAEAYQEFFWGIGVDPVSVLGDTYPVPERVHSEDGEAKSADPVLLKGIQFRSICEHHLLPFFGTAHVAYLPDDRVVGLGKLARTVEVVSARPQLQERLTEQVASALVDGLHPRGVLVVVEAEHRCVSARGPEQRGSSTVTVASRGELAQPAARAELIGMMGMARD